VVARTAFSTKPSNGARSSLKCENAPNRGSDALLMASQISGADDACLQQVDLAPTIHLAFNELQLGDLPLGLTIRPG